MSSSVVFIAHLDDQPENVCWIPRKFAERFWGALPAEMLKGGGQVESEDETEFRFSVQIRDKILTFIYNIYDNETAFLTTVRANGGDIAAVFLDQAISGDTKVGSNVYDVLVSEFPQISPCIFMLTAYPNITCSNLGWSPDDKRLITKPPNDDILIDMLLDFSLEKMGSFIPSEIGKALKSEHY